VCERVKERRERERLRDETGVVSIENKRREWVQILARHYIFWTWVFSIGGLFNWPTSKSLFLKTYIYGE
jgi:hypothetical protein